MDIACFIPLHLHYQNPGPLALPRTDWHCNDTCLLVDSPSTILPSKSSKKRNIHQTSSFELSRNKRQRHQGMLPRRRSSTTTSSAAAARRRLSQQQNDDSSLLQQSRRRRSVQNYYQHHQPQQDASSTTPSSSSVASSIFQQDVSAVSSIEDDLHHLQDEWATIDIVFNSIRNAFTIHPLETATEEHLDEVDRELSIAYDDLKAQVRHLERSLRRLDSEISTFRPSQTPTIMVTTTPSTTTIVSGSSTSPESKQSTSLAQPNVKE